MRVALLSALAGLIVIAAPRSSEPKKPFWIITPSCDRCDLAQIARARAMPGAAVCPSSSHPQETERCVREHWRRREPFVAVQALHGVDSSIVGAYDSLPDGGLAQLWYDSDTRGSGAECAAIVTARGCPGLADAGVWSDLCVMNQGELVCDESRSRVLRVERGGEAKELWCLEERPPVFEGMTELPLCARSTATIDAIKKNHATLKREDAELFCTLPWGPRFPDVLSCTSRRQWRSRLRLSRDDRLDPPDAPIPDGK